jgi:hypothetical protein
MEISPRTKMISGGLLIASLLSYGSYRWWMNGEPVRVANHIRSEIQAGRYEALYSLTVQEERAKNGWNEKSFPIFAEHMVKHIAGKDFGDRMTETPVPPVQEHGRQLWNLANERRFVWTVPFAAPGDPKAQATLRLNIVKDVDGKWKAMFGQLLRDLNQSGRKGELEYVKGMRDALAAAGLPHYYNLQGDRVLTVSRLEKVIRGEVERDSAWERAE